MYFSLCIDVAKMYNVMMLMTNVDDWCWLQICYDAWYINHMIKTLWLIFMSCYDIYDVTTCFGLWCVVEILPHIYCDLIYGIDHSKRLGVFLSFRIARMIYECTYKSHARSGDSFTVYARSLTWLRVFLEIARTIKGVPTHLRHV